MAEVSSRSIRILHVDDKPDFADMAATLLESEDERFSIETATGATEGLERLSADIDCVVSDYDMPEQNGIEFLQSVREEYPDLPFILFTGKGSEEVASDAIAAGVTDYLQKGTGTDRYTILAHRIANAVEAYQSATAARRRRHRFEQIIKTVPGCVVQLDTDGRFIFANRRAEEVLGLDRSEVTDRKYNAPEWDIRDLDGNPIPDDELPFRQVLDSGEPIFDYRHSIQFPSGERTMLLVNGAPVFDDTGAVESVVFSLTDITDQYEQKHDLRETERRLQLALEATDTGVWEWNLDTDEVFWDETLERVMGVAPGGFEGTFDAFADRVHPEDMSEVSSQLDTALETNSTYSTEFRMRHEDGDFRWVAVHGQLVSEDGHERMVGVHHDITDRKAGEARLKALNETTHRLMSAHTRDRISEIGVEAAASILGLDGSAIHLYDDDQAGLAPVASTDAVAELIGDIPTLTEGDSIAWRVYEQGETLALDDVRDDPDVYNPETPIESELYLPLGDYGVLIAGSDQSEAFDQQDVVFGEILADAIVVALNQVEQTEQLRARERELTRQNDRLEEFTSVVSHDLRNPLNVAEGRLELVRDEHDSEHLDTVARAHKRMEALIDDLLTLARHGETASDVHSVDLTTLTENCWRNVVTADATLVVDIDRQIRADRRRLQQLFENLMRNAVEHGGEAVTVTVGELDDGFYVEDNGPGIPESARDDVFDAGYSTAQEGTGFGLSIVRQVADAHGWTIRVTEGSDGGARFEIRDAEMVAE